VIPAQHSVRAISLGWLSDPLPGSAIRWACMSASLCQSWNGRLRQPQSLTPLDGLPQTPSTALLSAEEAKGRLREIVEGFFFRRNSEEGQRPARHLLIRSPPGLGKTKEAMEWATRYQTEQASKGILQMSRLDITPATEVSVM
jgi:hypothetical protein